MVRFLPTLPALSVLTLFSSSVAATNFSYDTLLFLVGEDCADLGDLGGLTVFGPTDDAFEEFLKDNDLDADFLCGFGIDTLTDILLYHVVEGKFKADDVADFDDEKTRVKTLQGSKVTINNKKFTVNGIDIVDPDAITGDFVLHGIDGVLIPPGGMSSMSESSESKSESTKSSSSKSESSKKSESTKSESSRSESTKSMTMSSSGGSKSESSKSKSKSMSSKSSSSESSH